MEIQANETRIILGGSYPSDVDGDGLSIWVANSWSHKVTQIDAASCTVLRTIDVSGGASTISSDGKYVWVTGLDGRPERGNILSQIDALSGRLMQSIVLPFPTINQDADYQGANISSDGKFVWLTNLNSSVTQIDASNGNFINSFIIGSTTLKGISSDGRYVWIANSGGSVNQLNALTGDLLYTFDTVDSGIPIAISSDGKYVWVATTNYKVIQIDISLRAISNVFSLSSSNHSIGINGIYSDGINVWVASPAERAVIQINILTQAVVKKFKCSRGDPIAVFSNRKNIFVVYVQNAAATIPIPLSINIQATPTDGAIQLDWNLYGSTKDLVSYNITQSINSTSLPIATIPFGTNTYTVTTDGNGTAISQLYSYTFVITPTLNNGTNVTSAQVTTTPAPTTRTTDPTELATQITNSPTDLISTAEFYMTQFTDINTRAYAATALVNAINIISPPNPILVLCNIINTLKYPVINGYENTGAAARDYSQAVVTALQEEHPEGVDVPLTSSEFTNLLSHILPDNVDTSITPAAANILIADSNNKIYLTDDNNSYYILFVAGTTYNVYNNQGVYVNIVYNDLTSVLTVTVPATGIVTLYNVGATIPIGFMNYPIFAIGTGGFANGQPSSVTNVTATPVNDTAINVSWSTPATVTDVTSYIVDICDGVAYDISYNVYSSPLTVYGLQASTLYFISITMVDSAGNLSNTEVVSASTLSPTAPPTTTSTTEPDTTPPTTTSTTEPDTTPPTTTSTTALPANYIPCFVAGTLIRTPAGEKAVELLRNGDTVVTADGRKVPIKVYVTTLNKTTKGTAPYLVPAHSFGHNSPPTDICLSPLHAFQIKKGLWMNCQYANNKAVQQYAVGQPITYYHIECPNFFRDNLLANGCVVESFAGRQVANPKNIYTFNSRLGGFTRATEATKTVAK